MITHRTPEQRAALANLVCLLAEIAVDDYLRELERQKPDGKARTRRKGTKNARSDLRSV
jgi:hypothetical protein